ncbi:MAG: lipid-A-disaccharide synthase N-terminal domain-containing protein [Parachlamydiaceae bacterium]
MDEWRSFLYPLGFLSSLAFGARFIIQWLQSEKAHKSVVPKSFWQISLIGNMLLLIHSFIQVQFHVCIVQGFNAVISWRNLNLMQEQKPTLSLQSVCLLLMCSAFFITLAFAVQDVVLMREFDWFRIPTAPWQSSSAPLAPLFWHFLGGTAFLLFSSRFWVQWWFAEKAHTSYFPPCFWWLSLIGAILSIAYFLRIHDTVNLIGPLFGFIPYVRNLMLQSKIKSGQRET